MSGGVTVVRATQSPMNARQWCLDLSCGHEVWITSKRRPNIQYWVCGECDRQKKEPSK